MFKIYKEATCYAIYYMTDLQFTRMKEFKSLKAAENWIRKNS